VLSITHPNRRRCGDQSSRRVEPSKRGVAEPRAVPPDGVMTNKQRNLSREERKEGTGEIKGVADPPLRGTLHASAKPVMIKAK
jgi:hypothetical protein